MPSSVSCLHDTESEPWKADRKPEPTAEQTVLYRAFEDVYRAKQAVEAHAGPYSGPDWTRKTQAYRAAWDEFDVLFKSIKREG